MYYYHLIPNISSKLSIDFIFSPFILDRCMSYEFWFVRPHVCSLCLFFLDNCSKNFSDFAYGYGALWVGWSDRTLFQGKIQIWPIMAENSQKLYFFSLWQKTVLRIFLIFGVMLVEMIMILYHPTQTTCLGKFWFSSYGLKSSSRIRLLDYFFRLWQRMTLRNFLNFYMMILEMILYHHVQNTCPAKIQTLIKNDCKEFSEFLHNDSRDDSLPTCTKCMLRKILVFNLLPKTLLPNHITWLPF